MASLDHLVLRVLVYQACVHICLRLEEALDAQMMAALNDQVRAASFGTASGSASSHAARK